MKNRAVFIGILLSIMIVFISHAQQDDFPVLKGPYLGQKPPGMTPELYMPGVISNCDLHSGVYFSSDGNEVYYSISKESQHNIMFMKEENGRWTRPKSLCSGLAPFLSPDGKTLLFTTQDYEIWKMERSASNWSDPISLGPTINCTRSQYSSCVTDDGTLYYINAKGIVHSALIEGAYTEPEPLGSEINSNNYEGPPYVAPDQSYMIFSSHRPGGHGRSDLHISFRREDGAWTQPKNMGPKINSDARDRFPFVSFDGKYFFFNSSRISVLNTKPIPRGSGNVYWVDAKIIEELKPEYLR
jgi:Tol biopolymer transport system component